MMLQPLLTQTQAAVDHALSSDHASHYEKKEESTKESTGLFFSRKRKSSNALDTASMTTNKEKKLKQKRLSTDQSCHESVVKSNETSSLTKSNDYIKLRR